MIKRIDLTTQLNIIRYWEHKNGKLYLCCFEGRYWSYYGNYRCESDLFNTYLIIEDEIKQEWGKKHPPQWVHNIMTKELRKEADKIIGDLNDEIPF